MTNAADTDGVTDKHGAEVVVAIFTLVRGRSIASFPVGRASVAALGGRSIKRNQKKKKKMLTFALS